ncbi:MAG: CoA-binding protein [Dehalococcoidia bacterium]|nr:CoA-binding protein [Dehalococcoidia bacterium]
MKKGTSADLDFVFYPRNVAVIGASPTDFYTIALLLGKMRDNLYLVNPNYKEVHGRKCYASILDIEGPLDYVILNLPTRMVPDIARECVQKRVKVIHSFSAGFSETGLQEGIELERELVSIIKGKVRLLGPNCMGIYCPKSGLTFNPIATNVEGNIGVIAQSGTFAQTFVHAGRTRNVQVSKLVSYGNAIDLNCPDFLQYMADDADTRVIAMYIEGIKDGRPLKSAMEYAAARKPVIVLKGGVTDQGGRVASSHTGSLAGSGQTWSTMFRQAGVVQVNDIDELLNAAITLSQSAPPPGNGVSIVTYSGGFGVVQSDMCIKAGLDVPRFSSQAVQELRRFVPATGTIIGNPLDAWQLFYNYRENDPGLDDVLDIISREKDIHSVILQLDIIKFMLPRWGAEFEKRFDVVVNKMMKGLHLVWDKGKLALVSNSLDTYTENEKERQYNMLFKRRCESEGFPVYGTLAAAVQTVATTHRYTKLKKR